MRSCTASAFLANPLGGYVVGPTWIYFADEVTSGCVAWGRPAAADAETIVSLSKLWLKPGVAPSASFLDIRGAHPAGAMAVFPVVARYTNEHRAQLKVQVTRFAFVIDPGFLQVLTNGFFAVVPAPYPVKVFTRTAEALEWLQHPRAASLADELEKIRGEIERATPLLHKLRATLGETLRNVSVEATARALGVSTRSMQRHLRDEGTTFEREVNLARVTAAQQLMVETDASLTAIAFDVGCSSPAHFSLIFRKVSGETPSAWRERSRR